MGFIPGMPNELFLTAALFAGITGYFLRRREQIAPDEMAALEAAAEDETPAHQIRLI